MQISDEEMDDAEVLVGEVTADELADDEENFAEELRIKTLLASGKVDYPSDNLPEGVTHVFVLDGKGQRLYEQNGLPRIKKVEKK